MKAYPFSHRGRVRDQNEDTVLVDESLGLYVVADGMGGHAGGEVASRMCVDAISFCYPRELERSSAPSALCSAVQYANDSVYRMAQRTPGLHGMGTTVVAAVLKYELLTVVHCGDSRCYVVTFETDPSTGAQSRKLHQLTTDHTYRARLDASALDHMDPELQGHLTDAVGVEAQVTPDFGVYQVSKGSKILLCTDGLWDELTPAEISQALASPNAAELLLELALTHGGKDNVSGIVVEV